MSAHHDHDHVHRHDDERGLHEHNHAHILQGGNHLHDASEEEVLDVRAIPRFVRHAAILGALSSLNPGFSLTIKAPHLPSPLLAQVDQLPGSFDHEILQDGPEEWLVKITRTGL